MKIAIGSDHGGFELKNIVKEYLVQNGHEIIDYGCNSKDSVDYPSFGIAVGEAVVTSEVERGIVICGSGIGISIAANKVNGVRCALVHDVYSAKLTRLHNDSNVLAMGGRIIGDDLALAIVSEWLNTSYEGGRHQNRIDLITEYEKKGDK